MKTILITGGSGLVGRALSELLISKGYTVIWLSRERYVKAEIPRYRWDYTKGEVDEEALQQADVIVHLAGANLSEGAWTRLRKQHIVESRVLSAQLLREKIKALDKKLDAFISASAIGYYGKGITDKIYTEEDSSVESDFLSRTCRKWEAEAQQFTDELGIRSVMLRTGFVISDKSEAMHKMILPTKLWAGAPIGSGKQYLSWIHIDDLCAMYLKAIEDATMTGAYNAVAPEFITNSGFMKTLAKVMKKPFFFPNVPAFFIRLIFGESAELILQGSRISAQKIQDAGFSFQYSSSEKAILSIIDKIKEENSGKKKSNRR